jgi:RNA polymerase sigma-70 factor (ECF subfamily)
MLDEPDRTIVRMQLEGYSYEEIGKVVSMTEKNVSVRLIRIKEKLRKKMTI